MTFSLAYVILFIRGINMRKNKNLKLSKTALRKFIIKADERQTRVQTANDLGITLAELAELATALGISALKKREVYEKYTRQEFKQIVEERDLRQTRKATSMDLNIPLYVLTKLAQEVGIPKKANLQR